MSKHFYVSSAVQAHLMKSVLIPQMRNGFWKDHRPADHATQWSDVEVSVATDENLGASGFKIPRTYNFVNPDFIKPNEQLIVSAAQQVKPNSNFRSVKKELIELSRIVGGRLTNKNEAPTKANRGNNKTPVSPSTVIQRARTAIRKATDDVRRGVYRTEDGVEVFRTSQGATVRRVSVVKA